MRARIRTLTMNGAVTFAAELLFDGTVIIYRDGAYVDEGRLSSGQLTLHDEFVPERSRRELQRKLVRALAGASDGADADG
jgi:hypothetical protein